MSNDLMILNIEDVKRLSLELAHKISDRPELVVYVAKGAYLIGRTIAEYFEIPLLEVEAVRTGNRLKDIVRPVLALLPSRFKVWLRRKEMNTGVHTRNSERHTVINDTHMLLAQNFRSILLVDDSVDTGNTIQAVIKILQEAFPQAQIQTAAFFVFESSKTLVHIDYNLYGDTIFSAPWSSDSLYHKDFMREYEEMKKAGVV